MPTFEYSGTVKRLLALPGTSAESHEILGKASVEWLFDEPIANLSAANCCFSGLWLRSGELDRSHQISQTVKTAEGSYWHAIMHRTEGDFWNSKYWLQRVGDHPLFETLAVEVENLDGFDASRFIHHGRWDPVAFVDYCESADSVALAERMAQAEWQVLFDFCWELAHEH